MNSRQLSAMAFGLLTSAAAHGASVSILLGAPSAEVGSSFSVDIEISGLGSAAPPSLGVFDFDLGFASPRVSFQGVTYGTGLDVLGLGSIQVTTPGPGSVNLFELSLDSSADLASLQPDTFVLATLLFRAEDAGVASFSLTPHAFGNTEGTALEISMGDAPQITILDATDGTLPEPATYGLAALALVVAGAARRRQPARPRSLADGIAAPAGIDRCA